MGLPAAEMTAWGRRVVLAAAFLSWLAAGVEMGLGTLVARAPTVELVLGERPAGQLSQDEEARVAPWFAWYLCAFLLGAAVGGVVFGRLGDRIGRVRTLGLSVMCFALFTGAGWFVRGPEQLLALRFLASLGIGGTWPCGVALVSEAWEGASRPLVAGVMGAAANVGILLMALIAVVQPVTPDAWRWALLVGATPVVLGVLILAWVPESPRWLAHREAAGGRPTGALAEVLRPPLLGRTLLGICLGTVPLLGTWSSGKWMIPWAEASGLNQAHTQALWAVGAVLGSAVGGWVANRCGRRSTYFVISLGTLVINLAIYRWLHPTQPWFLPAVFLLGLVATVFFGWLPLYLPELFPTRVRATGAGVTFNAGRVASAAGVLAAGGLMTLFGGDYARVGEVTAWVYALGMVVILFAPDTSKAELRD